jgi:PGF-CTERM protein
VSLTIVERRTIATILAALALVSLAGCASVSVHSTVDSNGTISEYRMNVTTSRTAYGLIEQSAEEEGYENVSAYLLSDVDDVRAASVRYDESFDGDSVTMSIAMEDVEPNGSGPLSVTRENGTIRYVDETFYNESYVPADDDSEWGQAISGSLSVDYYLTMPAEITDSNADSVDGRTAEWHESGPEAFESNRIVAESEVPGPLSTPGFGLLGAVLALLAGAFLLRRGS